MIVAKVAPRGEGSTEKQSRSGWSSTLAALARRGKTLVVALPRFGRRTLVAGGALGALAVAVGAFRFGGYQVRASSSTILSSRELSIVDAIARRIAAPLDVDVSEDIARFLEGQGKREQRDFGRLLAFVEHLAPLGSGNVKRFTSLSSDAQDHVLSSLERHPVLLLRAGFQALKALVMLAIYTKDASWAAIGYDGPVVRWSQPKAVP